MTIPCIGDVISSYADHAINLIEITRLRASYLTDITGNKLDVLLVMMAQVIVKTEKI